MDTETITPAKRRMTVGEKEAGLVERARQIEKLRAKRERLREELSALDLEIAGQEHELRSALLPSQGSSES